MATTILPQANPGDAAENGLKVTFLVKLFVGQIRDCRRHD